MTRKRCRYNNFPSLLEFNATSRPGSRSMNDSYSVSPSGSEAGSMSRAPSPERRMMSLRLGKAGVEYRVLNEETVPNDAKALFFLMDDIGHGRNIVPHALKSTVEEKLKDQPMSLSRWDSAFMPQGHDDGLPGRVPSLEEVESILEKAVECEKCQYEELMWNARVHLPLLDGIFEDRFGEQCDDFNAMICTTARPHAEFEPMPSTGRMVDICVHASLDQDEPFEAALAEFSGITPTLTVNHTDFEPLQLRPLVLSIGTRRPGLEWDKAQLQMGVWHASQWAFLRWAVGEKLRKQRPAQGAEGGGEGEEGEEGEEGGEGGEKSRAQQLTALSKLGFIPGIIVQGNRWHLVMSTYHEGKTTLWAEWVFGTTKSLMDIYCVVAGLIASGAIVLGKANLSELSNSRGSMMPSGWSAVGGQAQSAYVRGGLDPDNSKDGHSNPLGSSSGSAVGVSARYAPISAGTETDGSLLCPAGRAALYTIKPTIGLIPQHGIVPMSTNFDSAGPMTKTSHDLAVLLDVLASRSPSESYTKSLTGSWSGISVATLDYSKWRYPDSFIKPADGAEAQIANVDRFVDDIDLVTVDAFELEGKNTLDIITMSDMKRDLTAYLGNLGESEIRTIYHACLL
ncbi:uncharacterized protein Triagg1_7260 [Trichoderma aggressivum f. europaeum]|uniref:PD-(D/E)XK nuclease-like domain-containing protein n=1 Tax=Trichoderma aggressivum f. europaeum TaxID=173218 RepID=A0AAE1IC03_9HYPO|nr:hypothetical protein Triagg1_7260 [Trichoderma aggressivum f. europaeum]